MSGKSVKRSKSLKTPAAILLTAKFLEVIAPKLFVRFAARLFTTPIRHKLPKREHQMELESVQKWITLSGTTKKICVYHHGTAPRKILVVHGWSGRGTQLVKIADALLKQGFSTVSFDAPAHGKSTGSTTLMPEFITAILQIDKQFGPFDAAVGHSLGGMSLLNAAKRGFKVNSMTIIGSGDIVKDITDDFIKKLQVNPKYSGLLRKHFEAKTGETMDSYSAYIAAKEINLPVLVIHDNDDDEVPVSAAHHIYRHLKNGKLMLTDKLGHRKILGDPSVIKQLIAFVKHHQNEKAIQNKYNDMPRDFIADRLSGPTTKG